MTIRTRRLAPVLLAGATAFAMGAAALAGAVPAVAATATDTTTTAAIMGSPVTNVGSSVWYDSGSSVTPNPGPHRDVTLTAKQVGADLKVTVAVSKGPNNGPVGVTKDNYQLDAFVRLDGNSNSRGKHFEGPLGAADVGPGEVTFAAGATITGVFKNVTPGTHSVALTDLMMDSGQLSGEPSGFDVFYNSGTSYATIVTNPTDWDLSTSLKVTDQSGPKVSLTKPSKAKQVASWKTLKGTSSDASGVKSVSVKLTDKRGGDSYYYTGSKWKKASSAKKAKKAAATVKTSLKNSGAWSKSIKGLKSGKLTIRYWGVDNAGNQSDVKSYTTNKLK